MNIYEVLIVLLPVILYLWAWVFILYADKRPPLKRKQFRIAMLLFAVSTLVIIPVTGIDASLLVFAIPVLSMMLYLILKYTKICERCGWPVHLLWEKELCCSKCGGGFI
jgi:hypothetical protein